MTEAGLCARHVIVKSMSKSTTIEMLALWAEALCCELAIEWLRLPGISVFAPWNCACLC